MLSRGSPSSDRAAPDVSNPRGGPSTWNSTRDNSIVSERGGGATGVTFGATPEVSTTVAAW
ncbi:hypothetical protein ACJ2CR_19830 [Myxococcus faecalis]|uniref:hypothetical protein n=1 Tax=Myxococcus faecalis TaxID=3115646 RepID=UPI0038CF97E3